MYEVIAFVVWAVPVALLVYLCWVMTNILRGVHRISERLDRGATVGVADQDPT